MRNNTLKGLFAVMLSLSMVLVGCKKTPKPVESDSSESTTSQDSYVEPSDYYNSENFTNGERAVTTTKLVTYDGPSIMESSSYVDIKVNGHELFVYETRVNHGRVFSWTAPKTMTYASIFDFEGKVHVEIEFKQAESVSKAVVRPLVYGINPSINNKTVSFDLSYNDNYVVEINDDYTTAIQLFANEIEKDPVTAESAALNPNMIYVGPGVYYAGAFPITDNTEIYLAGGAYVYGQFSAEGVNNVKIRGRGIVSGSIYSRNDDADYFIPVVMRNVTNLTIEDVCFFDPAGWALHIYWCKNVRINNVKIITARSNGDGISLQSCENAEVNRGYVRTWDDSLVVKNVDQGKTDNVKFNNVSVWTDLAQCMEVGYETHGTHMENITFKDITIMHAMHKAVISLHNCDDANIKNVTYENITVEDCQTLGDNREDGENDFLMDFVIAYNIDWSSSLNIRGTVDGINVKNVKVYKMLPSIVSRIQGEGNDTKISNVNIQGIEINGRMISTVNELDIRTNDYVNNITYTSMSKVLGAMFQLPYSLELQDSEVAYTNNACVPQEGAIVPEFARSTGDLPYIGEKASVGTSWSVAATHGVGTKNTVPADDGSGTFGEGGNLVIDGNDNTKYVSGEWKGEDAEFAALTIDFDGLQTVGAIRIKTARDNVYAYEYSFSIFARKLKSDSTLSDKYTILSPKSDYSMTPKDGNVIDVNIASAQYGGIQIRFFKNSGVLAAKKYEIAEIEFFPPSLTLGAAIVDSTEHADVYNVERIVDGRPDGTSYYESKTLPATIVIDLGDVYTLKTVVLRLIPDLKWAARDEEIEISVSDSNLNYSKATTEFNVVVAKTAYTFDPATGSINTVAMNDARCRFLKLVISSNTAVGGYGAQLSEVSAYGTK